MSGTRLSSLVVLIVALIVLAACGGAPATPADEPADAPAASEPTEAPAEPTEAPAESEQEAVEPTEAPAESESTDLTRFVMAVPTVPKGQGDRFATNEWALYKYSLGRLIIVDENGDFVPWLALSWEAIEPTIWQFTLRPDVQWWNGDPFTAEDVKYSFDYTLNPDNDHPQRARISEVEMVEVVDDLTVNVHTSTPSGALISNIPSSFEVLPAQYHQEVGTDGFNLNPVGVGPYKVKSLSPGERMVLERNELFWGDQPYFDEVEFRQITEESTRLAALEAGEVDAIFNISPENAPGLEENFNVIVAPQNRIMTLIMSCEREMGEPLCDTRVRRAIALALDKDAMSETLYGGLFPVAKGHTANSTMFGFNPDLSPYPYDPEEAQALLNEAGYGDGFALRFEYPQGRWTKVQELAETIAAQLGAIGIQVELIPEDSGTWLSNYINGETVEMTLSTLGPAFDLDFNTVRFTCDNPAIFYCDEAFDEAYNTQKELTNPEKREAALQELAQIFNEQVAGVPLFEWQEIWAFKPGVENIKIAPDVALDLLAITREE